MRSFKTIKYHSKNVFLLFIVTFTAFTLCVWIINYAKEQFPSHYGIFNETNKNQPFAMPNNFRGKDLPFHEIYEPRMIAQYHKRFNKTIHGGKPKAILLWTPWNHVRQTINYYFLTPGHQSFIRAGCPEALSCTVVENRELIDEADAILFHILDIDTKDLPKYRRWDQLWIVYDMEPPWLIERRHIDLELLNEQFNLSMSYRNDSDITVKYGIVNKLDPKDTTRDLESMWYHKTKSAIWMVSDCITDSAREDYVKVLRKYIDIDIYGRCGRKKCFPAQSAFCYESLLKRYKFYLSFENAICKDYVTEKFFNVFNYDIIPVVFGGVDYSKIVPSGSFINANDFPEPKDLASEMFRIGSDASLYADFLKRKSLHRAFLDPWPCRLCETLHTHTKLSVIADVRKYWITSADCQKWNETNRIFQ